MCWFKCISHCAPAKVLRQMTLIDVTWELHRVLLEIDTQTLYYGIAHFIRINVIFINHATP